MTALAALAAGLCLALPAAGASASAATGGVGAPTSATGQHAASKGRSAAAASGSVPASALATWYGPGLYGRRTACGQTLTQAIMGVANRTLPCGTLVRVGFGTRSLVLPVIDRGPFGRFGAEWDLTAGAAAGLGMTETERISAHVVGSAPNTPTLGVPAGAEASGLMGGALAP